jgi:hypothetical protein
MRQQQFFNHYLKDVPAPVGWNKAFHRNKKDMGKIKLPILSVKIYTYLFICISGR